MFSPGLATAQQTQDQPKPEPVRTTITVVEKITTETPANVTVVDSTALQETAGTDLDDRLRDIPGFSLFKRASSVVANPTTQGVSLRGIGSSGASRTLMLWDGVPVNDPFGGWVYWSRFVPDAIDRVEIDRGAASSVFGNLAMSGTIAAFSRPPERRHLFFDYEIGNRGSEDISVGGSQLWSGWALSGAARAFETDGYYIVPVTIRGPVDRRSGEKFVTGDVFVDRFSPFGNFFFKVDLLAEERQNGTILTHNSTGAGTMSLHYVKDFGSDSLSILAYGTEEGFHSTFSSVNATRTIEKLTYQQTVPSDAMGGAVLWQHHQVKWNFLAGADAERIEGVDTDRLVPTGDRIGGGIQVERGLFAQGDVSIGGLRLFAGGRESLIGHTNFLSPSAGAAWGYKRLRLRGSVYRAFRAPTLNELYRSFSAGNTFTEANAALKPETVFGSEIGADWLWENSSIRVTAFRNSLADLITNVTLSSSATSIVRQRQNAADALSRGLETSFHRRIGDFSGNLNYLYVDSRYDTGPRISQIPRHQGTANLSYLHKGTMASIEVRSFDYQFDDDLNQFRLPGYTTVQLMARQRLVKSLSADVAVENALDRVFYTAYTPTPNIGSPRLWRVGLRWH
jgi:outer membrane cobalamin receptor